MAWIKGLSAGNSERNRCLSAPLGIHWALDKCRKVEGCRRWAACLQVSACGGVVWAAVKRAHPFLPWAGDQQVSVRGVTGTTASRETIVFLRTPCWRGWGGGGQP